MPIYVNLEDVYLAFENAYCDISYHDNYTGEYISGHSDQQVDDVLRTIPSADVVEVVRCKECKHYDAKFGLCERGDIMVHDADFFCAYGESMWREEARQ